MKFFCVVFIVITVHSIQLDAWRIFHLGRMSGGNLGKPPVRREDAPIVSEEWFNQKLDHFTPTEEATWQQRYFVNDEFYNVETGGPVFLMIGGEGAASDKWMTHGSWVDYAQKYGALLFQLEHRFYGKSQPTKDMSTDNLKHLTSQQALADLANFISAMNIKYTLPNDVKWIAFGGSYPGSLAAWLRFKYPHLVRGAMSASGPILAELDFKEYFRVVKDSLATHSTKCVDAVTTGIEHIEDLLKEEIGQENLNQNFRLCDRVQDSIDNPKDISNLFETIADNFAGVVQYNKDNRIGSPSGSNITIDVVCNIMVNETIGPAYNRLAAVNALLLNTHDQKCTDYKYDKMLETLKNISWTSEAAEGGRQWTYQTCTEFGFYQTSTDSPHIFGDSFPISFFVEMCRDIFGNIYDESFLEAAIERTNILYGGLDIEVSNVVFVHGTIDPWHALGITKTVDPQAPAILIEGTAHCANMYPKSDKDPPQLTAAREEIEGLIDTWLSS